MRLPPESFPVVIAAVGALALGVGDRLLLLDARVGLLVLALRGLLGAGVGGLGLLLRAGLALLGAGLLAGQLLLGVGLALLVLALAVERVAAEQVSRRLLHASCDLVGDAHVAS